MKAIFFFATLCLATSVFAATETGKIEAKAPKMVPAFETPNLNEGNIAVGGGLGMGYSSYSGLAMNVYPTAEYFLMDRFSVGGTVQIDFAKKYEQFAAGPSATYYFWQEERWAAFGGGGLLFRNSRNFSVYGVRNDRDWILNAKIGMDYFFYPSVAFGPYLKLSRYLGGEVEDNVTYGTLLMQFSVFL